ncbi:tripartite tricarboxylate transporter TctB family protein [Pseudooceanicola onchidii]|uniref:tripartite tricarboxylate transporter TctB family protein n=1 Tax=Pseudooceanicola onchidii TaxID=2562279 RepID=UPI0010A9C11F|nr:tripartite tricarboxylate transporter TctB family protein [Pseudooceanicola onchidii]
MRSIWSKDVATAVLIIVLGVAVLLYAQGHYKFGSFRSPGPGLFPVLVSGVLAVVGVGLLIQALMQGTAPEDVRFAWRPFILILGAIAVFAVTYPVTGVAPSVFLMVIISSYSDNKLPLKNKVLLASIVTVIAVVLFTMILGVRLPVIAGVW